MSTTTIMCAPAPTNNYAAYRECCAEQTLLPPAAWTFKADPRYRRILEHVTPEQAAVFRDVAHEAVPDAARWDALLHSVLPAVAAENDALGAPEQAAVTPPGIACSPSNLRYFCHAVLIWTHLAGLGLAAAPGVDIVELGGGYGGLALYLHRLAPAFGGVLASYTIVDLPEAAALQRAYAAAHGLPLAVVDGLEPATLPVWPPAGQERRYCISNYAFSEFDRATHEYYRERLVRRCAHGFLVWNFAQVLEGVAELPLGGPLYPFVDAPLTVVEERPTTGPGNVVVTW